MKQKREFNILRKLVLESVEESESKERLLSDPNLGDYNKEDIQRLIEENISKEITKELDLDKTEYAEQISDTIHNILKTHHIPVEPTSTNDYNELMKNITIKIHCQIDDIDAIIDIFTNPSEDNEEEEADNESDSKVDMKKVEKTEDDEPEENVKIDEAYTQDILELYGRDIRENVSSYGKGILKEYCKAQKINYKKLNIKTLFKKLYI